VIRQQKPRGGEADQGHQDHAMMAIRNSCRKLLTESLTYLQFRYFGYFNAGRTVLFKKHPGLCPHPYHTPQYCCPVHFERKKYCFCRLADEIIRFVVTCSMVAMFLSLTTLPLDRSKRLFARSFSDSNWPEVYRHDTVAVIELPCIITIR